MRPVGPVSNVTNFVSTSHFRYNLHILDLHRFCWNKHDINRVVRLQLWVRLRGPTASAGSVASYHVVPSFHINRALGLLHFSFFFLS